MKKVIKLALVVMCAMCSTSLYAQKFARTSLQEVSFAMSEFTQMQTDLEAFSRELGEQLEAIQVEFNNQAAEFQRNGAALSESVRSIKEREFLCTFFQIKCLIIADCYVQFHFSSPIVLMIIV